MKAWERAEAVAASHPDWTPSQIAAAAGCSTAYVSMLGFGRLAHPEKSHHEPRRRRTPQDQVFGHLSEVAEMVIGPWRVDECGNMSREIRGV